VTSLRKYSRDLHGLIHLSHSKIHEILQNYIYILGNLPENPAPDITARPSVALELHKNEPKLLKTPHRAQNWTVSSRRAHEIFTSQSGRKPDAPGTVSRSAP
jgi:hypothetical protein